MNPVQFIAAKRDGQEHSSADLQAFVQAFMSGAVVDYQAAAWLMAAFLRGLSSAETLAFTDALANSGRTYPLGYFGARSVDKHSTGGVGDKTTLVVAPLCAALGVVMPKMSGRGLGFTGGTLDKLESIPGFRIHLSAEEFEAVVSRVGVAICAQTSDLVPADGRFYALRDVTATVESAPLIAASIMSKKLAIGCPSIVLDIKVGSGSFGRSLEQAEALARLMLDLGSRAGRRMTAVLSGMEQPLGLAVGNSLEVLEAVAALRGQGPADLREHSLALSAQIVAAASLAPSPEAARPKCLAALDNGRGLAKLAEMIRAQGGDADAVLAGNLPRAPLVRTVVADRTGFVSSIDTRCVGEVAMQLGAGRSRKEDTVDHRVGIVLLAKVGDAVQAGQALADVHAASEEAASAAAFALRQALTVGDYPPRPAPLVLGVMRG